MKGILSYILLVTIFFSCSKENHDEFNKHIIKSSKNKYSIEHKRDVESINENIEVDLSDLEMIQIRIFPSFMEAHSLAYNTKDQILSFHQITDTNLDFMDPNYHKLDKTEREKYTLEMRNKYKSQNFRQVLTQEENNQIAIKWSKLKQNQYKFKNVEQLDGAEFFTTILEHDTIVYMNTNSPSSSHALLIKELLNHCKKYAPDFTTKQNVEHLIKYL